MSHTLALLFLIATGVWATCYRPGGFAADYRYVPCHDGKPSMCCRTNDPNYPDVCRADSLCQETLQDVVWRESCTDPSWQAPECLRLCLDGYGFGNDSIVTFCLDNSICCGWMNTTCCEQGQGVWISNGQVVTTPPPPTPISGGLTLRGKIGIGVGLLIVVVIIGVLAFLYTRQRRRHALQQHSYQLDSFTSQCKVVAPLNKVAGAPREVSGSTKRIIAKEPEIVPCEDNEPPSYKSVLKMT